MKIAYKGTYNFYCRKQKYEIGKIYEIKKQPILCVQGFHYCTKPYDVLNFYEITPYFKLLEVEDLSDKTMSDYEKSVTNKIRIIRQISDPDELKDILMLDNLKIENNHIVSHSCFEFKDINDKFYNKICQSSKTKSFDYRIFIDKYYKIIHRQNLGNTSVGSYEHEYCSFSYDNLIMKYAIKFEVFLRKLWSEKIKRDSNQNIISYNF